MSYRRKAVHEHMMKAQGEIVKAIVSANKNEQRVLAVQLTELQIALGKLITNNLEQTLTQPRVQTQPEVVDDTSSPYYGDEIDYDP